MGAGGGAFAKSVIDLIVKRPAIPHQVAEVRGFLSRRGRILFVTQHGALDVRQNAMDFTLPRLHAIDDSQLSVRRGKAFFRGRASMGMACSLFEGGR